MNYEMRVEEHSNPLVVFMHQMIPHHENAVNMARYFNAFYILMHCVGDNSLNRTKWKSFHLKFDHVHFTSKEEFFIVSFRIALKHAQSAEGFNDETLDVPALLRDIINTQNKQIQDMQGWLER